MPRPNEARIAGLHLPVAALFLAWAAFHLAANGVAHASVLVAAILAGMGSFTVLVLGTGRMLLAGIAKIHLAGGWWGVVPGALAATGTILAVNWVQGGADWAAYGFTVWGVGIIIHLAFLARSLPRIPARLRRWHPVFPLLGATAFFALIAATWYPLQYGNGIPLIAFLHILLAGFVTHAILLSLYGLAPRFSSRPIPHWWAIGALVTATPGALLVAAGTSRWPMLLHPGAALLGFGLLLAAYGMLHLALHRRRVRPAIILYLVSAAALITGTSLAVAIAFRLLTPTWVPLHGVMNVFGFMGGLIFAASIDLYGPGILPGRRAIHAHAWLVAAGASISVLLIPLLYPANPLALRLAFALYGVVAGLHAVAGVMRLLQAPRKRSARPSPRENASAAKHL